MHGKVFDMTITSIQFSLASVSHNTEFGYLEVFKFANDIRFSSDIHES